MRRFICKIVWLTNLLILFHYPFVYTTNSPVKIDQKEEKITLDNGLIRLSFQEKISLSYWR